MPAYSRSDFGPTTQQFDAALTREALPSGTRVGGYQIVEVLGGGGVGIVYLALDLSLQRQVAIKEFLPNALAKRGDNLHVVLKAGANASAYADGLGAFLNQAKLLARFDHPSLVRVHSYWEEHRTAYMVMPFYNGQTLATRLKALDRPPEEAWLRALLMPLLSALNLLHAASCYHRGISPDNIVLLADGQPVLLDFGAASRTATRPKTGKGEKKLPRKALLHAGYAPIEQYNETGGAAPGPWTDLYSLAGVIYNAITKRTPAMATSRVINDPHQPLSVVVYAMLPAFPNLDYSLHFIAAIDKALALQPKDRPQTVAEFQSMLDQPRAPPTPPPAVHPETPDDAVRAAIAAALRSVPNNERMEPSIRFPEVRESTFPTERHLPPLAARNVPPKRSSVLPWVFALCVVAAGTWGGWAWFHSQQVAHRQAAASSGSVAAGSVAPAAVQPGGAGTAASGVMQTSASVMETASIADDESAPAAAAAPLEPTGNAPSNQGVGKAAVSTSLSPSSDKTLASRRATVVQPLAQASAPVAEPNNPMAMCAPRTNFALVYCMQTQCKRPKFAQHAQCAELKLRGDLQ